MGNSVRNGQLKVDAIDHVIQRLVDVVYRDPKHSIAVRLEPFGLLLIRVVFVMRTVDLHHKASGYAEEVDHVRSQRDLTPELMAVDLPVSQP